jgi:hypothetical protein
MTSPSPSVESQKAGGGPKFLVGAALTLVVGLVVLTLFSHRGLYQTYRLRNENERLARTIDRLHHDPVFIQDLIRKELNYVKKNDIIFQFPPEKPVTGAELPATGKDAARLHTMSAQEVGKSRGVVNQPLRSLKASTPHRRE